MPGPDFRYLLFRDSDGFILLDIGRSQPFAPPQLVSIANAIWDGGGYTMQNTTLVGPLVQFPNEETARNAHQIAGKFSKLENGDVLEVESPAWTAALSADHPGNFTPLGNI